MLVRLILVLFVATELLDLLVKLWCFGVPPCLPLDVLILKLVLASSLALSSWIWISMMGAL